MRFLIGGLVALSALGGAVWFAVANATPSGYPGGPYQIYIFDNTAEQSIYAVAVGQRATGALVENCVGRLMDDRHGTVSDLRDRVAREDESLNLVWVSGEGSSVDLGTCEQHVDARKQHGDTDSLVIVRDASAAQVRDIIHEIHALPAADRQAMIDALGLDRRTRARR